uniref:Uncharacterized protein n=1 Tax=mine drainage metagenome TaxID=410659 RepID=E6PT40_9ZZZZ
MARSPTRRLSRLERFGLVGGAAAGRAARSGSIDGGRRWARCRACQCAARPHGRVALGRVGTHPPAPGRTQPRRVDRRGIQGRISQSVESPPRTRVKGRARGERLPPDSVEQHKACPASAYSIHVLAGLKYRPPDYNQTFFREFPIEPTQTGLMRVLFHALAANFGLNFACNNNWGRRGDRTARKTAEHESVVGASRCELRASRSARNRCPPMTPPCARSPTEELEHDPTQVCTFQSQGTGWFKQNQGLGFGRLGFQSPGPDCAHDTRREARFSQSQGLGVILTQASRHAHQKARFHRRPENHDQQGCQARAERGQSRQGG